MQTRALGRQAPWTIAAIGVLVVGIAGAALLAWVIGTIEHQQFEAVVDTTRRNIARSFDDAASTAEQFTYAMAAGLDMKELAEAADSSIAGNLGSIADGLVYQPFAGPGFAFPIGRQPVAELSPSEVDTAKAAAGRPVLTRRPGGSYAVLIASQAGVGGLVIRMDDLVRRSVTGLGQLVDLELEDAGELVYSRTTSGTPIEETVPLDLGGRRFGLTVHAGPDYAQSGVRPAFISVVVFSFILAGLILALGSVWRSRMREAQQRAELAEGLSDAKDRFIASISHELRTPLSAVFGFANELVERGDHFTDDERDELIAAVLDQSRVMARIVEDMLVAARLDAGTLTVLPSETDLAAEVRSVVDELVSDGRVACDLEPVHANIDPLRLRQIVRNIVANAIDHGGKRVRVELRRVGPEARIRVIDDGPGVPDPDADLIFLPYYQAGRSESVPSTLGLGLPVARELAAMMGGDVKYRRDDSWTVFELVVPVAAMVPGTVAAADAGRG